MPQRTSGPWLTYRGLTARYGLSESTLRRLIALGLWPAGRPVTGRRRLFDQAACDLALKKLFARDTPVITTPPSGSRSAATT